MLNTSTHSAAINGTTTTTPKPLGLCVPKTGYIIILSILGPITILGWLMDVGVLLTFLLRRRLITPFTVHIIHLQIINILNLLIFAPLTAARPFKSIWFQDDPQSCAVFQYVMWTLPTMTLLQETVICLDRWCAIAIPVRYSRDKKIRHGIIATMTALVWYHLWYLPLNILNYLTPLSQRMGCDGTIYPLYRSVIFFMVSVVPALLVYGSYPVLIHVVTKRRTRRVAVVHPPEPTVFFLRNGLDRGRVTFHAHRTNSRYAVNNLADVNHGRLDRSTIIINNLEFPATKLAAVIIGIKLPAILFQFVILFIMFFASPTRPMPRCMWDAFHLSELHLTFVQAADPFIYLVTFHDLRREFLNIFRLSRRP